MPPAFVELSAVLVLATFLGIVAKFLRQPLIVAYIFSGVIISSLGIFKGVDHAIFELLSNLGIAFLLFLVGVDLKIEDLKYVGKAAFLTGLGQIVFTTLVGFILVSALGFATVPSLYIAFAITFSSTVIVVKLLSEKNELQSLYGKVSVGVLLVQDIVAILFLMVMSGVSGPGGLSIFGLLMVIFKGAMLLVFAWATAKYGLRYVFRLASSSLELLFVSTIAWAFALSAVALLMGFSTAIGAFLAGIAVASSPYRIQISGRIKPIRDFFIIIFFILLGASISFGAANVKIFDVLLLSLFTLLGAPLIVLTVMITFRFRLKTAFMSAITMAQVSEFSLILMTLGQSKGLVTPSMVSLVSAVAIVTITLSSYLILYGDHIYTFLEKPLLKFFPQKPRDPYVVNKESLKDHVILVGGEQMGWDILLSLKNKIEVDQILVVDFNPDIVKTLKASGYNAVFGDISDPEVLEELELGRAKLIIMTALHIHDSEHLIRFAKSKNYKGPIVAASYWMHDAIRLYELGADLVVVPEMIGGKHIARIVSEDWNNLSKIKKEKSKRFEELMSRKLF
ncbi:cation:proton antiporter [Candidatus Curtissbacteria bacterium]|nr:cation:proton antiporter [Candidatus Curtissbacteria bacterium]